MNPLTFNSSDVMHIDNFQYQSSPRVFNGVRGTESLVFCAIFCRSLHSLLQFLVGPLHFLFIIGLRPLTAPLVS
jgi:hypothetical protein